MDSITRTTANERVRDGCRDIFHPEMGKDYLTGMKMILSSVPGCHAELNVDFRGVTERLGCNFSIQPRDIYYKLTIDIG
jgi:hypothetical protein